LTLIEKVAEDFVQMVLKDYPIIFYQVDEEREQYNLDVSLPSEYATKVLDKNHTGLISVQQIATSTYCPVQLRSITKILLQKPKVHYLT
jgi:hypothetical protein